MNHSVFRCIFYVYCRNLGKILYFFTKNLISLFTTLDVFPCLVYPDLLIFVFFRWVSEKLEAKRMKSVENYRILESVRERARLGRAYIQ